MKGRSPQQNHSAVVIWRRSLLAATLIVSLLSALVPLAAASSVHLCTMACCAGKAPHEAGSCSSGLMKSAPKVIQEPEVLCGLHLQSAAYPTATRHASLKVIEAADNPDSGDSGGHDAGPDARANSSESTSSKVPGSSRLAAPAMTSPCATDCAATCSVGYVRQPRPRERAAVAWAGHARPPSSCHLLRRSASSTATLRGHYQQPRPRGPPTSLPEFSVQT